MKNGLNSIVFFVLCICFLSTCTKSNTAQLPMKVNDFSFTKADHYMAKYKVIIEKNDVICNKSGNIEDLKSSIFYVPNTKYENIRTDVTKSIRFFTMTDEIGHNFEIAEQQINDTIVSFIYSGNFSLFGIYSKKENQGLFFVESSLAAFNLPLSKTDSDVIITNFSLNEAYIINYDNNLYRNIWYVKKESNNTFKYTKLYNQYLTREQFISKKIKQVRVLSDEIKLINNCMKKSHATKYHSFSLENKARFLVYNPLMMVFLLRNNIEQTTKSVYD